MTCGNCTHLQTEMTEADGTVHGYGRMKEDGVLYDKGLCLQWSIWKWSNDEACDEVEDSRKQRRLL